ncbi:MAG: hypothetical protein ACE5J5_08590 [Candidatus Hydrothermarchaeales archaeon]
MRKRAFIIIFLLILTLGCLNDNTGEDKEGIRFQISGETALSILESNPQVMVFIKENFENESNRITRVALVWNKTTDRYLWKIELMERSCGCLIEGEEGLNVINAEIDPETGEIIDINIRKGVKEETLARERCMEGCHSSDKKVDKLMVS